MKHIIFFIFVLTATMYTFAQESVSSPIIKGKDNKNLEFFKSNKLQSPISPTSIFGQEIRGVVYDKKTGITAYAAFETYQPAGDKVFATIPAETMVMYAKESDKGIRLSVCDPNLNIEEKTYTTKEPSRPITKEIRLKGHWTLTSPMENVRLEQQGDQTVLTVTCQHGQPVEMLMENK